MIIISFRVTNDIEIFQRFTRSNQKYMLWIRNCEISLFLSAIVEKILLSNVKMNS